jgi:hypothetical protein
MLLNEVLDWRLLSVQRGGTKRGSCDTSVQIACFIPESMFIDEG